MFRSRQRIPGAALHCAAGAWLLGALLSGPLSAETFRVVRLSPEPVIDVGAEFGIEPGATGKLCHKEQVGSELVEVCPLAFRVIAAEVGEARVRIVSDSAADVGVGFTVELDEPPTLGVVEIRSSPDGARATVDGRVRGNTPLRLSLRRGSYSVTMEAAGHVPWEGTVTAVPGEVVSLSRTLPPGESATAGDRGPIARLEAEKAELERSLEAERQARLEAERRVQEWDRSRLDKAQKEKEEAARKAAEAARRAREAEAERRRAEEAKRSAEAAAAQRAAEAAKSRALAQRTAAFDRSLGEIHDYLNRGNLATAEALLDSLEQEHPGREELAALRENLENRRAQEAAAAQQARAEAERQEEILKRQQSLTPSFRHRYGERPSFGCFNTSLELDVKLAEGRGPFYILAGEDLGSGYRALLVREVEGEGRRRYGVFINKGRQGDVNVLGFRFANWAKRLREAGRVTFYLLYPEEYGQIGRPREGDVVRADQYARLKQLPSQTRGYEWPPGSGCAQ